VTDPGPQRTFPQNSQRDTQGDQSPGATPLPPGDSTPGDERPEPPAPVRIAYELWCAVAALGVATTTGLLLVVMGRVVARRRLGCRRRWGTLLTVVTVVANGRRLRRG